MKYFIGIGAIVVGVFMVIKTEWMVSNFGMSEWAEQHLGGGGTRLMYKVLGILFVFLAMAGMTGLLGEMILGTFGQLFGLKNTPTTLP